MIEICLDQIRKNTQELFAGGASFKLNEDLEVYNLEIFVDIPIDNE